MPWAPWRADVLGGGTLGGRGWKWQLPPRELWNMWWKMAEMSWHWWLKFTTVAVGGQNRRHNHWSSSGCQRQWYLAEMWVPQRFSINAYGHIHKHMEDISWGWPSGGFTGHRIPWVHTKKEEPVKYRLEADSHLCSQVDGFMGSSRQFSSFSLPLLRWFLYFSFYLLLSSYGYRAKFLLLFIWFSFIILYWSISDPEKWCCESVQLNMPANLENSEVATGLENVSFHSNPKERQSQRMLKLPHNCTHLTR